MAFLFKRTNSPYKINPVKKIRNPVVRCNIYKFNFSNRKYSSSCSLFNYPVNYDDNHVDAANFAYSKKTNYSEATDTLNVITPKIDSTNNKQIESDILHELEPYSVTSTVLNDEDHIDTDCPYNPILSQ